MSVDPVALEEFEAMLTLVRVSPSALMNQSTNPYADGAVKVPDILIEKFGVDAVNQAVEPWRTMGWTIKRQDGRLFAAEGDDE